MRQLLLRIVCRARIWKDDAGQDMIEYALMLGFVAVSAGAFFPPVADSITTIFSRIESLTSRAAA